MLDEGVGLGVGAGLGVGVGAGAGVGVVVVAVVVGDVGELFPPPHATVATSRVNAKVASSRILTLRGPYTPSSAIRQQA
jgi:hypothetical protein